MPIKQNPEQKSTIKNILFTGFITGTLDGLAAMLINYKVNPAFVFKFIASGAFGKAAFGGGAEMIVAGVLFHYIIAFAFSAAFYLAYPFFINGLRNKYAVAFIYGMAAWIVMNIGVVPHSKITMPPGYRIPVATILTGMATLIICIGLPVVLIADRQNKKKTDNHVAKKA
ncbi:hypothetical protein AAFN85_19260 [Mucilaginibacter sp. CAU 1740]|uniref:hypothetical protein n=1 Tax=Mucilaginibacter sp. CAU 1740 TaxID=3140365 RepID=UPI00325B3E51